jgi:hypothetical protein
MKKNQIMVLNVVGPGLAGKGVQGRFTAACKEI